RIICPPTKSTPKFNPWVKISTTLATISNALNMVVGHCQRRKLMLVLSGISFSRRILAASSNVESCRPRPAQPERHPHAGEVDGGEYRGGHDDHQHDGKALDRTRTKREHQGRCDDMGYVGVEDCPACFGVAELNCLENPATTPALLSDTLVDQHVGV